MKLLLHLLFKCSEWFGKLELGNQPKPRRGDLFVIIDAVIPIKLHRSGL
jgi:hypothetical protein